MTKQTNLKIIPLGGLGEVGRNMTLLEYDGAILIIDMGLGFPEEDMPGIDFTVPNVSFLKGKEKNILGLIVTHGHYDHIGAIQYLARKIGNPPIFTGQLTKGIILKRQEDFPFCPKLEIIEIGDGSKIQLHPFQIEFFRQNHNVPDNFGVFIKTPVGNILHTSDFKFDNNPINDPPTNFQKLKELSQRKILLLMSDSTGAEEPGHSLSEKVIEQKLEEIFKKAEGRIIAATFASLLNRIQQIINLSEKYQRKVIIEGRSMKNNIEISKNLNYLKSKKGTLIKIKQGLNYPDSKLTIVCTGAQGEDRAVLNRIANREHRFIRFKKQDLVILSSSIVPGNERTVQFLKDNILRQGAKIFHYKMMDIHAGGHAQEEELKKMLQIMKPKFFLPIQGHYSMLINHGEIAKKQNFPPKTIIAENGQIINLTQKRIFLEKKRVPSNYIMVDGLGIGDVEEVVLRDRQNLAQDGMFVVIAVVNSQNGKVISSPDIISRGFVYLKASKNLLSQTRKKTIQIIDKAAGLGKAINWNYVKAEIRNKIGQFLYTKTQRRPMILPVIIEV